MWWSIKVGNHPENNLAKFGYQVDMKVERKQNCSIFLATYSNLSLKIWWFGIFFPLKSVEFEPFFPMKTPLCRLKSYFSGWKFWQKFAVKRNNCEGLWPDISRRVGIYLSILLISVRVVHSQVQFFSKQWATLTSV